jgi:two-component system OmpR family response regulator
MLAPVKRVLIADDDAISLRFLESALRQLSCATFGVASLTDALAAAASTEFDLLLLDRNMPGGGGVELLAAMRKRGVDAPAIATSAEMSDSTRAQLHAVGFVACVEKPVTLAELGEVLRPWLHVPALDDAAGLAAIGGDLQALRALRAMLADELSKLRGELAEDAIAKDVLLDRLHRLRASCGFCGAPKLAAAAISFEQALRANASGTPDRRGNFVACITETIDALPA